MKKLSPATKIPEKPTFRGLNLENSWLVPTYTRNLPHMHLEGAIYFVTFRLADSIPLSVAERWVEEREHWLNLHGIDSKLAKSDPESWNAAYNAIQPCKRQAFELEQRRKFFIELDNCYGSCILKQVHSKVGEALVFFHGKRIWCGDYIVMPNHVHVLVQIFPGIKLEEWLYSVKRFSSAEICKDSSLKARKMMRKGHLWQSESFDRIVRNVEELKRMRRYIANNPAKLRPGTYTYKQMAWLDEFAGPHNT